MDSSGQTDTSLVEGLRPGIRTVVVENDVLYEQLKSFEGRYHDHYHNRLGLDAPSTAQAVSNSRPELGGRGSSLPWGTLMFASQPASFPALD